VTRLYYINKKATNKTFKVVNSSQFIAWRCRSMSPTPYATFVVAVSINTRSGWRWENSDTGDVSWDTLVAKSCPEVQYYGTRHTGKFT